MMFQRIARFHPILWLGGVTIAVMAVGPFVPLEYDDRGLGTAWFVFTYAVTFVFRKAAILSTELVGSETGALHAVLTLFFGCAVYIIADLAMLTGARRLAKKNAEPSGIARA